MNAGNEKNRKKYPLLPYLIGMFVVVIPLVLLSYFAQQRNDKQLNSFSQEHSYKIEDLNSRIDQLELRIEILESKN